MKAKIHAPAQNGKNYSGEKEIVSAYSVMATVDGELREVVICRCYMGRSRSASTVYCSLWVHGKGVYAAGHGSAGGYGYHKESAALAQAITSAGITLYGSPYAEPANGEDKAVWKGLEKTRIARINGCGESSMVAALEAIARAATGARKVTTVSHG